MNYIQTFIRRIPSNSEEEFLIAIGKIHNPVIMCHEETLSEELGHEIILKISPSFENTNSRVENRLVGNCYVEVDPFDGRFLGRYFRYSSMKHWKSASEYIFEVCKPVATSHPVFEIDNQLAQDKLSLTSILTNKEYDDNMKACKLLVYLLDRQMIIDDADFDASTYEHVKFAYLYDQVIDLIKRLDYKVWEANECQITLPSINDHVYDPWSIS